VTVAGVVAALLLLLLLLEHRLQTLSQVTTLLGVEEHSGGQMIGSIAGIGGRAGSLELSRRLLLAKITGTTLENVARRR